MLSDRGFNRVSRRHARVSYPERGRIEIEDMSRNGTFVNGSRIQRMRLAELSGEGVEILLELPTPQAEVPIKASVL